MWKVSSAKNVRGEPLLLSNGFDANGVANLSFEREFGKRAEVERMRESFDQAVARLKASSLAGTGPFKSGKNIDLFQKIRSIHQTDRTTVVIGLALDVADDVGQDWLNIGRIGHSGCFDKQILNR